MALTQEQKDRLAQLREEEVSRAQDARDEADLRELEARELTATLEARGLKRDAGFKVIVNARGGVFAVKKPDTRAIRNWENAADKDRLNLEWMIGLLRHYIVEPDEKAAGKALLWAQTCAHLPGLCWQTSAAFIELMGVDLEAAQKK